jgi:hypothetical protein
MSKYSEYNKQLTVLFEDIGNINQFIYQIIVILLLIIINEYVNVKNVLGINKDNKQYLLPTLITMCIIFILIDLNIWNNSTRTSIFTLIIILYSIYINQQKKNFDNFVSRIHKEYFDNLNIGVEGEGEGESEGERDNNLIIPSPNVLDYVPDNIHHIVEPEPYMKGGELNKIDDTIGNIPALDQSDFEWNKINKAVNVALEDRHKLMNDVKKDFDKSILLGNINKKTNDIYEKTKWDLSRYYPNCKLNEGITHFDNKTLEYCSNLPEIDENNYKLVSGNEVELLNRDNPYINVFPKQFDIGGMGIVSK